ncbi:MAG: guanylate kinase [Gemmatimonadota bacterium]
MIPFPLVLSSPSGGGKSTIARELLQGRHDLGYSVSATTRKRRPNEVDGNDYFFLSKEEFGKRREQAEFIEWATYADEHYGTLKSEMVRLFREGRHAVLDIEIEGARQLKAHYPDAVTIFVLPPSGIQLVERLRGRNTETVAVVRKRLERAAVELKAAMDYDYVVVNDSIQDAVGQVAAIIEAECRRVKRQDDLSAVVEALRTEVLAEAQRVG